MAATKKTKSSQQQQKHNNNIEEGISTTVSNYQQQKNIDNDKEAAVVAVKPGHIKCLMYGVGTIVILNLALTITSLILGLHIKSEIQFIQTELQPLMEFADQLETIQTKTAGGGNFPNGDLGTTTAGDDGNDVGGGVGGGGFLGSGKTPP